MTCLQVGVASSSLAADAESSPSENPRSSFRFDLRGAAEVLQMSRVIMVLSPLPWALLLLTAVSGFLVIKPPKLVVEFEAPASAVCSTNDTHMGMGWEAPLNPVDMTLDVSSVTWEVESLTEWNIKPFCFMNARQQMKKDLLVIIYKVPDNVSIAFKNCTLPVTEGSKCELLCSISKVAPAGNVVVKWYKGQAEVKRDNISETDTTPKDKVARLLASLSRSDHGAEYRCEAQLELGPDGPQPPRKMTSNPLTLAVLYGPKFSSEEETVNWTDKELFLNCTVSGYPPPSYSWDPPVEHAELNKSSIAVLPQAAGRYSCTAKNSQGSATKVFIIKKSDDKTTFWAIIGTGLVLAVGLLVGYLIFRKVSSNSVI